MNKQNTRSLLSAFIFFLALYGVATINTLAADGDLDASFGSGGIVTDNFGGSFGILTRSVKIQPDGKILTGSAVLSADFAGYDFGLLRYNANGTLDTSFGANGRQIVDINGGSETVPTVLLQADDKIIVVGNNIGSVASGRGIVLTRLNSNGSFDASFGANGKVVTGFVAGIVGANLQADDKIVVVGGWSGNTFSTARFNADGTLDESFGTGGVVQNNITANTGVLYAVAFQPDGKIIVGGIIADSSPTNVGDFIVFRYQTNGAIDATFGGSGYVRIDFNNMRDAVRSLVVQPDGKIIAAGLATIANNIGNVFGIVRFNSDGSLDSTFGTAGKVSALPVNAFIDQINDRYPTILQPDGKIVVGRTRFINNNANDGKQSNIARFNANGSLDTTFGAGGQIVTTQLATLGDLALQTDGKIVATGSGLNNGSAVTARYLNTAGSPTVNNPMLRVADFDNDGRTDAAVFRNGTWFINPSSNPSLAPDSPQGFYGVQFGLSTDRLVPADYDGDGKTDIAVWRENTSNANQAVFYILQSQTNTVRTAQFGRTGDNPAAVGDWDGDRKADVAVYRAGQAGGQSYFFYRPSSQPTADFTTVAWGTAGDEMVRGDFDGDRKMDAAVFRASNATWYILQSSNNQLRAASWGAASDKRISGDYDADGKTDLAIYRSGLWAILQSSNNQPRYQNWGAANDSIVAGDYDGDGRTDFAVFRSGVFYVLNSGNSQSSALTFGQTGDAPVAAAFVQ